MTAPSPRPADPALAAPAVIGTQEFRDLMAEWPTGVAVVTSRVGDKPVGCTVTTLTYAALDPPRLLVCLAVISSTLAAIRGEGRFGVNILSLTQSQLGHRFARVERDDRFSGVGHIWALGVPLLDEAATRAVFEVERNVRVGDHVLVVARPLFVLRDNLAQDTGPAPALRFRRGYWNLGQPATST